MMWAQWRQGSVYVESLDALLNKGLAWLDQANRRNFDLDFGGTVAIHRWISYEI